MVYSRSEAAWLLSCKRLFHEYKPIYFWTFTFVDVLDDWVYPARWAGFVRELVWGVYGGRLAGLRVIEVHKEHGLHYHALLNQRLWVRLARKIGRRYGIGRVHVEPCNIGASFYLAKYLDKDRFPTRTRIARWHSVGIFEATHKNNIEVISPLNNTIREAIEAHPDKRLTYAQYNKLYLHHFDVLCNPRKSYTPFRTPHPNSTSFPNLTPTDLDEIWNPSTATTSTPTCD